MITATHDPLMIEHVGRVLEMADGELIAETDPADWGPPA